VHTILSFGSNTDNGKIWTETDLLIITKEPRTNWVRQLRAGCLNTVQPEIFLNSPVSSLQIMLLSSQP
jgi:hypothetical protein